MLRQESESRADQRPKESKVALRISWGFTFRAFQGCGRAASDRTPVELTSDLQ